jgi:hypothetical protein
MLLDHSHNQGLPAFCFHSRFGIRVGKERQRYVPGTTLAAKRHPGSPIVHAHAVSTSSQRNGLWLIERDLQVTAGPSFAYLIDRDAIHVVAYSKTRVDPVLESVCLVILRLGNPGRHSGSGVCVTAGRRGSW